MAEPASARAPRDGAHSVGDLVALTIRDLTRLVRYEVGLAKLELRADVRRLGFAAALGGMAAFAGCVVLVLLCFAFAYGLMAVGIWPWASFLIVSGVCVLIAAAAIGIVAVKVRKVSGLRRTRQTVQADLALLRRDDSHTAQGARTG